MAVSELVLHDSSLLPGVLQLLNLLLQPLHLQLVTREKHHNCLHMHVCLSGGMLLGKHLTLRGLTHLWCPWVLRGGQQHFVCSARCSLYQHHIFSPDAY